MFKIVILLSGRHGRGSNMAALALGCASGLIPGATITHVIGTHSGSPALARAESMGLATAVVDPKNAEFDEALLEILLQAEPDLICLAGFMRKAPDAVLSHYPQRIVNVHPALLPSFGGKGMYGIHVHEAVLEAGCKISGCTVHFVDEEFDTGPIIAQQCVPVLDGDTAHTLAARVLTAEHSLYPEAVRWIAEGRVRVEGRRVLVTPVISI